ncbi:hypothetical protein CMT56_15040 [Elizabethkingia anophelis]|jgi:preprotein translocase subunit SecB|uniref:protein-export chaperone SecB n=1 Tax=Elizabethkingia anophelis TaxID=1117645 RepID=UPI000994A144|nr:protein-export chaperone SecB [Elizabethkingia anophelis]HAY3557070.1 hypothetical protein [Elizabethkingia meningoseptica]AQW92992.1 hypothetical protein BBD30_01725 [Elizabethkingia anophelis]MDV3854138.1 hypothetical protein [Elizabethkingia anophelis]MDV3861093.1 hypothetical protein [Elizabethkingia anophelis]MDV3909516.1 hypothetical protein [Elizabethkingia anophelis]
MKDEVKIQNKIKFDNFFVEDLNYSCDISSLKSDFNDEIEFSLDIASAFNDDDDKSYLIKISVEIKTKDESLKINCKAIGAFITSEPIDSNFKNSPFVRVNSPAILFPFIRSYINTITSNSGIPPLILPSVNFTRK